ncbi:MAG: carboxynorspermidine decarboxylase [Kiritimatiellae bacterium]|nr:carboxynorspermidine decarboxylase [Kiritimatiellia bacterium]
MPRYVIDERALRRNLEILKEVADRTGARILLAQKAFSCAATYPLCARYLAGTTASSLFEARHGRENFGGETHVFAPAFNPGEMDELLGFVDHIVFNSPRQVELFGEKARARRVSVGMRVNPEVSVAATPAYDPCRPSSRLGTKQEFFSCPDVVEGLHFHCLCEQGAEELSKVLAGFEERFGGFLPRMKWVNFGGGHHITRADYDVESLVALIADFRARHPHLQVYLEPGEAVALDAGTLESRVLEVQPKGADGIANAILDTSAACHMPDVLEMPYTPRVTGARTGAEGPFAYRFGGPTCLAGDEIGVYSFDHPLREGDEVVFEDMAIYSMVKNNTFNGVNLPDIVLRGEDGTERILRSFGYADFASRLG